MTSTESMRGTEDNLSPPLANVNLFTSDPFLHDAVEREGGGDFDDLARFGALAGSAEMLELGRLANENAPQLKTLTRDGKTVSIVDFDPGYHRLMAASMVQGLHCSTWERGTSDGAFDPKRSHVARAAGFYMAAQMEAGHCCPITMTHAAVAALRHEPDLLDVWLPRIASRIYDPDFRPAGEKSSATLGMGMTERQGGTDVRTNTTRAEPIEGGAAGEFRIFGHKYFMSAPMCDAFLVLAQAPAGLSCFLMPRVLPDGDANDIDFVRLKDKLGNRSNASAEVGFNGAHAWRVGDEGRGVRTILEMVTLTRLDCAISSAGLMRFALAAAVHHCRHRQVFQRRLTEHPLMVRVLADMALHVEAATMLVFRLTRAFDNADADLDAAWRRVMTPVTKYWICKTAPALICEAMECLGGNGYVEDASPLARLYREAPVNAIWEGSGNVMGLDLLRIAERHGDELERLRVAWAGDAKGDPRFLERLQRIEKLFAEPSTLEANARIVMESMAELAAGILMRAYAPQPIADAYLDSRFQERGVLAGGARLGGVDATILDRAVEGGA